VHIRTRSILHTLSPADGLQMSADGRKRIINMENRNASIWLEGVALVASLASATSAWGGDAAKRVAITMTTPSAWAGQNAAKTPDRSAAKPVDDDYIIGPSDMLAISVWKDSELTRTVLVRPDGKISLPLVGELEVSGLTALKVQRLLTEKLKEYVDNPQVTVIVNEVRSRAYTIVGKVSKQGSFELGKPTTVLDAIAIAGGPMEFAKLTKIYVIRRWGDGSTIKIPFDYKKAIRGKGPDQNIELRNGDTIVVP
jgi:polysaccharide export outer membrane protein